MNGDKQVNKQVNQQMTGMEESIEGLQGELDVAKEKPKNHFKPGWLFIVILTTVIIGLGSYTAVKRLEKVDENKSLIKSNCEILNEQLETINEKFQQLNELVIARLKDRPDGSPNPPEVLKAFEKLQEPIPITPCTTEAR